MLMSECLSSIFAHNSRLLNSTQFCCVSFFWGEELWVIRFPQSSFSFNDTYSYCTLWTTTRTHAHTQTHIHTHTNTHILTNTHAHIRTQIHTRTHTHIHTHAHIYTHAHTHLSLIRSATLIRMSVQARSYASSPFKCFACMNARYLHWRN